MTVLSEDGTRPIVLYLITHEMSALFLRGQLRYLIEAGFDVFVGTRFDGSAANERFDPGVEVVFIPFVREPSLLADAKALIATVQLVRKVRPNVVNASTPKAGLLGMLAARLCRVPVRVYVVRGLRFETAAGVRRRVWRSLERIALKSANHVIFNSRSLRSVAERDGVVRRCVGEVIGPGSGNGIARDRFANLPSRAQARAELGLSAEAEVVGFVGRFTTDKGVADLVGLLEKELRHRPRLALLLVGEFEPGDAILPDVRRKIESHERIVRRNWLNEPGGAYRAMDVLAFPSAREGLPNVPLEAQFCGIPVVGYAATGTVDAVRNGITGILVHVGDRVALGRALDDLLSDSDKARNMGTTGAEWVRKAFKQEYIWAELAAQYKSWLTCK